MIESERRSRVILLVMACLMAKAASGLQAADPEDNVRQRYVAADANGDRKLSLDEYLKLPGEQPVLQRDFNLFDFDGNQSLSLEEFHAVPLGRPAGERGPLPDPILEILERAVTQMDAIYGQWDEKPDKQIPLQNFMQSFVLSFPDPNTASRDLGLWYQHADENQNKQISREEARRFLEIQLGIRSPHGDLLRLPNGQVVNFAVFLSLDPNGDSLITRDEFQSFTWRKTDVEQDWKLLDQDRNGSVTFEEFINPKWVCVDDPIERFREFDVNQDAFVDQQELLAGTKDAWQRLPEHALPGFDLNKDGRLSLREFRQLPQSNPVFPWLNRVVDANRDEALQFAEFFPTEGRCALLRLVSFLRFDVDQNGSLSSLEFPFPPIQPQSLYRVNADGTGWQEVFSSKKYPQIGSVKISRDGLRLLCDAVPQGQTSGRRMLLMTIDGKNVIDLGAGMMPTWSPDGEHIAYSHQGVQQMDLKSKTSKVLVRNGWGAQWSPDGKKIAFTQGSAIRYIDPESEEIITVLDEEDSPYQQIFWNMGWSPDSNRLCFKGIRKENKTAEIASVRLADGPELKVHYNGPQPFSNCFAWSPDGKRVAVSFQSANQPRLLMHEFDPEKIHAEPTLVPGTDHSQIAYDPCWSPDGKFLMFDTLPE